MSLRGITDRTEYCEGHRAMWRAAVRWGPIPTDWLGWFASDVYHCRNCAHAAGCTCLGCR